MIISKNFTASAVLLSCALGATSANAHFQLLYTPELLRDKGGNISLKMPFTHPASNGYVMDVATPQAFYSVRKGRKHDLLESIKTTTWGSAENTGTSYEANVTLRGLGDHVFILEPSPYLEEEEGAYIQQITKSIVNVGSLPTDWSTDFQLKAEIVPLTKPYAIYAGSNFRAVVKSAGKPVPNAEVEIEYVNYQPDLNNNRFSDQPTVVAPAPVFVTQTIFADQNGIINFTLPFAGQWGFAALGVGPDTSYQGKPLSQDAVIWVQAHEVNKK